jgi:hypothetical protein
MKFSCSGCDCIGIIGFKEANWVFEGDVRSIVKKNGIFELIFDVFKVIKGDIKNDSVKIYVTCLNEACCGKDFNFVERYEVYTYLESGLNYTGFCTETFAKSRCSIIPNIKSSISR